ncbi:hypothetical protein [Micromonospora sp. LOL_023]|uniref:hypothetical protein n=1 Tax=Micromonospora sp. LOL_023 TaxID=3345418 RepID=UPI003A8AF3F2
MPSHTFGKDDLVVISPVFARPGEENVVYRVVEVHRVNLDAAPVSGGRPIRAPKDMFEPTPETTAAAEQPDGTHPAPANPVTLWAGSVVTVAGPRWTGQAGQLYVVLRTSGDKVSLVKLGGDNGRYWRGVHRSFCTLVDPSLITMSPATQ